MSPQTMAPDYSQRVLYHEAGHVVFAVRREVLFEYVEVREGDWGEVPVAVGPLENPGRTHSAEEIARWQECYAAGAASELLFYGDWRTHGAQRDRVLHEKLERLRGGARKGGWEIDIQAAVRVLDRESVEKVANALDHRKKLSDVQVYELLGCTPPWW